MRNFCWAANVTKDDNDNYIFNLNLKFESNVHTRGRFRNKKKTQKLSEDSEIVRNIATHHKIHETTESPDNSEIVLSVRPVVLTRT